MRIALDAMGGDFAPGPIVAGAWLLLAGLAYAAWRRWRRPGGVASDPRARPPSDPRMVAAASLYRGLESALQAHGIVRAPSVPPLRHAEELRSRRHPLADEVLSLTHVYLATRFGGAALTEDTKRDFDRRLRNIRAFRANGPASA